ncbi:MAG: DsbE family thiol:disulfide interchange protein [Paracoccaceae bacterium]
MARARFLTLTPVAAFALLGLVFVKALAVPEREFAAGFLDRPLPDFTAPPLSAGADGISAADFDGGAVLLNVFASWCASCRAEHPMLMRLSNESPVPIYGLNWRDRAGRGRAFLDLHGDPYAATGSDSSGALGAKLGVTGVPETYVIDAEGRIRYRHIGPIDPGAWDSVIKPLIVKLGAGQ